MFWTALALIMTVLMGGIIAYNGDLIGRKYGKRRVSLFNLRPKHTAILITSVTGVVISAVTTGVMFLLVPQVREIILEGEHAIRIKGQLEREAKQLSQDVTSAHKELQGLKTQVTEARKTAAEAQVNQQKAQQATTAAQQKLASTEHKLATEEKQLASAQRAQRTAEHETQTLRQERVSLKRDNSTLSTQVSRLHQDYKQIQVAVADKQKINQDLDRQNGELGKDNIRLTRENTQLDSDVRDLRSQIASASRILKRNQELLDDLNREISGRNQQIAELQKQRTELEKGYLTDRTDMLNRFQALRTRKIAVHGGEDLGRIIIPANARPNAVLKLIGQLKQEADKAASAKGARPDEQSVSAVQVVDKQVMLETAYGSVRQMSITENDRVNALVNKLSLIDSPVCLLAIAVANSAEGEPAAIDFQPFNDWLVYPKGRVIASKRFSGHEPPDKLFPTIMAFLKDVGQTAIQRGVIPRIDPMTGNPEVGSLNWTQLVQLVDRVRRHPGEVQIIAYAKDDTKASDPLNVDFDVKASL